MLVEGLSDREVSGEVERGGGTRRGEGRTPKPVRWTRKGFWSCASWSSGAMRTASRERERADGRQPPRGPARQDDLAHLANNLRSCSSTAQLPPFASTSTTDKPAPRPALRARQLAIVLPTSPRRHGARPVLGRALDQARRPRPRASHRCAPIRCVHLASPLSSTSLTPPPLASTGSRPHRSRHRARHAARV